MASIRPSQPRLRSALYVPGNKLDWMVKAPRYQPDALVLDLEDSVPPADKDAARERVAEAIDRLGGQPRPRLFVRLNPFRSGRTAGDVQAIVRPGLFGVYLPKDQGPEDVARLDALLSQAEQQAGLPAGQIVIRPMLESARAIREAYEVATASPRVGYLGMGAAGSGDFARVLGFHETPQRLETLYYRSKVILDARAAGIPYPMGGVWMKVKDLDGLRGYAQEARNLGYFGMQSIYPGHVAIINEIFSPSAEEIDYYRGLVAAVQAAEAAGTSAVVYRGDMVDIAHLTYARQVLADLEEPD